MKYICVWNWWFDKSTVYTDVKDYKFKESKAYKEKELELIPKYRWSVVVRIGRFYHFIFTTNFNEKKITNPGQPKCLLFKFRIDRLYSIHSDDRNVKFSA